MSENQETAPAKLVDDPGITLGDKIQAMFDITTASDPSQTGMRIVAFDPTRIALVFSGPEAEPLALQFIRYAEALIDTVKEQANRDAQRAQSAAARGDVKGMLANARLRPAP